MHKSRELFVNHVCRLWKRKLTDAPSRECDDGSAPAFCASFNYSRYFYGSETTKKVPPSIYLFPGDFSTFLLPKKIRSRLSGLFSSLIFGSWTSCQPPLLPIAHMSSSSDSSSSDSSSRILKSTRTYKVNSSPELSFSPQPVKWRKSVLKIAQAFP